MSQSSLVPLQQKQVLFNDDQITAALVLMNGQQQIYVSIRQMCELLGVAYQGQIRRINDDPVLSKHVKGVNIMFTPNTDGRGGGRQVTNCLPIDYLNGWLFGINAKRVRPEVRERLIIYQEKCHRVLARAFRAGELTSDEAFESLLNVDSPSVQAYKMIMAMAEMARQQILMEARVNQHEVRLTSAETSLTDVTHRLESIETQLGNPARLITPEQAMQISQAVKAVAAELGKVTGRNEYGGVYGELYRRYSINSYKLLPAKQFQDAMSWLNSWLQDMQDDDVEF